jgi:hypothetical protein
MKYTDISGKAALIALAAVCLLAAPALSMPMGDNGCRSGHGGMFDMKNNLTPEEMDNMTLGELKEMQRQSCNESGSCPQMGEGQNRARDGGNCGDHCQMMGGQMNGMDGQSGRMMGGKGAGCDGSGMQGPGNRGSPLILLMGELTMDDLRNMTLNEIKDLAQTKMQELDNMTLAQIKELETAQVQTKENLTLAELKEENRNMHQMERILSFAGAMNNPPA